MERSLPENGVPPLGVYEHYKSSPNDPRFYRLIHLGMHTETNETFAIYLPVDDSGNEDYWLVRPLTMFLGQVQINNQLTNRFRYVE